MLDVSKMTVPLSSVSNTADRLSSISRAIAAYLASAQLPSGDFPAKSFYGKAFSALLWALHDEPLSDHTTRALVSLQTEMEAVLPATFHHEFNRYALLKLASLKPDLDPVSSLLRQERYVGTRVANWMLLRAFCRVHSRWFPSRFLAHLEIFFVQKRFILPSGVIEDQRGAYTMQYHAFCCALLGELGNALRRRRSIDCSFRNSVDALSRYVLPGGQCNYVGRGSLQSFGYAAATLAFAHAYRLFGGDAYLRTLQEVLRYLSEYQRCDGSFPLVLSNSQEGPPATFDLLDYRYAGWWSYNNYYDYLPFTGAFLELAARELRRPRSVEQAGVCRLSQERICSADPLRLIRKDSYTAVLALPNIEAWSSSLPFPYLEIQGKYPLPCYGGEQHRKSIYSRLGLPLPIIELDGSAPIIMADATYTWDGDSTFSAYQRGLRHSRSFLFEPKQIRVVDQFSWNESIRMRSIRTPRLMLPTSAKVDDNDKKTIILESLRIEADSEWCLEDSLQYSPNGALECYFVHLPSRSLSDGSSFEIRLIVHTTAQIRCDHPAQSTFRDRKFTSKE